MCYSPAFEAQATPAPPVAAAAVAVAAATKPNKTQTNHKARVSSPRNMADISQFSSGSQAAGHAGGCVRSSARLMTLTRTLSASHPSFQRSRDSLAVAHGQ